MCEKTVIFFAVLLIMSCSKPLFVSHLSPEGIALTKKKGYGRPVHHWYSVVVCFDVKCRKKAAWAKSQKAHRYNGFKNVEPALENLMPHVVIDSVVIAKKQGKSIKTVTKDSEDNTQRDSLIVLSGEVFFDFNSSQLRNELKSKLDSISKFLNKNKAFNASVSGHTDNTGNESYNLKLSEKRAENVALYLIDQGVEPDRISYVGMGSLKPVMDNSTEEGKRKNRRVEIKMSKK